MECCPRKFLAIQRINSINLIHAMEFQLYLKPLLNRLLLLMVLIHKKQDECSKGSCTVLCLTSLVSNSEQSIMMHGCDESFSDRLLTCISTEESFFGL